MNLALRPGAAVVTRPMIINYSDGASFIQENEAYLSENTYMSSFFFLDAPLLKECSKKNYALKVYDENGQLLAMKVEPYFLLLYGEKRLLKELLIYIKNHDLEIEGVYAASDLGEELLKISKETINKDYYQQMGMDFMEAHEINESSSNEIEIPTLDDADEIVECLINFINDCGLTDQVEKEKVIEKLTDYRIIRLDNKIVALSRKSPESSKSIRISMVYTRPEYRNRGLARKVVNYLKNEILNEGKIATLNVDQANPISNHLYKSIGFKKVFSRGIFLPR